MPTRVVHRVRCRKKDNKQIWADVKVVDAVTVIQPGGQEKLIWVKAADADPCIIDKTKAEPSNAKGQPDKCTRLSHMELVTGQDDSLQKMYVEVLDAVVFNPPTNNNPTDIAEGGTRQSQPDSHGLPKPATFGKGLYGLFMPEKDSTKFIVDKVGLGLDDGSSDKASRSGHVSLVTEKGNTDDKTDEADAIPPQRLNWVAVVKPDAVNFKVPGGDVCLILPKGKQEEIDWTVMTTDPTTGEPCPPDNTDPNVYVSFPRDDTDDPNKPCVGCNLKIPIRPGGQKGIDQGPLWWIERVSPGFRPWFWYAAIQSPKAFSYFGSPGRLGNWAWRGFVLWNYFPVIWILASNLPLQPMGEFGSPSLDLCARIGDWDYGFPPVPSQYFQVPRGDPNVAQAAPTQMEVLGGIIGGGIVGAANDASESALAPAHGGAFGPFGILQMTHPPIGFPPDGVPYGAVGSGGELFQGKPNIWQLTGLPQPKRTDPTKVWNPFSNPHVPPSAKLAEEAAKKFESNWNAVANGHNAFIEGFVPGGGVSNGASGYGQPPGWNWAIPWFDGSNGPPTDYRASFQNGIPPGVATKFFPLEIYSPATSWTLHVDQLRPDWWDTTHLEFFGNPFNALFPIVLPPFLWTNDPWTGTNNPPHNNPPSGPG